MSIHSDNQIGEVVAQAGDHFKRVRKGFIRCNADGQIMSGEGVVAALPRSTASAPSAPAVKQIKIDYDGVRAIEAKRKASTEMASKTFEEHLATLPAGQAAQLRKANAKDIAAAEIKAQEARHQTRALNNPANARNADFSAWLKAKREREQG